MGASARQCLEEVFSKQISLLVWTSNTLMVLPATLQNFAVGSLLPAVLYMFRRGVRRGKGRFEATFASPIGKPSIWGIAAKLAQDTRHFDGFGNDTEKDILGDLLLCDALENKASAEGQDSIVARAFPVHFFASWLDLPESVAHLRFVPELLVAALANQPEGLDVQVSTTPSQFAVGAMPGENLLFSVFGKGTSFGRILQDLKADTPDEGADLSIEELLMIRLAQSCGEAPEAMRSSAGKNQIPNAWPIAARATQIMRRDLSEFLSSYGNSIPRRALTPMLESLIGLSLFNIYVECLYQAVNWERSGAIPDSGTSAPFRVLVDASAGNDDVLRNMAERSFDELLRLLDSSTTALAAIRIVDAKARFDRALKDSRPKGPDSRAWLNMLGMVRAGNHERSDVILNDLAEKQEALASQLEAEGIEPEAVRILRDANASKDPVRALSEAICVMMGDKLQRAHYLQFLDSCLMITQVNGLATKRRLQRAHSAGGRKMMDMRSIVLSNAILEALVHRYVARSETLHSLSGFISYLRDDYGLCVDEAPLGLSVSRHDLLRNRAQLERRLRELGILVGVNDAESMKRLVGRFPKASIA